MNKKFIYILFVALLTVIHCFGAYEDLDYTPSAFEKLYVTPHEILSTAEGTFYIAPDGEPMKVASVSRDCEGTYVILITRRCQGCGRYYNNDICPVDGYCCPLLEPQKGPYIFDPKF